MPRILAALAAAALPGAFAASLEVTLVDGNGQPLADAVAFAVPKSTPPPAGKREAQIEQVNKAYVPLVTVIQTGTSVQFPNRDAIRHHVYSFSPAKPFELKLYVGTPAAPVVFDKPGEVVLGCNIHDRMIAYVYVVDTPYFVKTNREGKGRIEGLPAGDYELRLWHYAQASAAAPRPLKLRADEAAASSGKLPLRPMPPRLEYP